MTRTPAKRGDLVALVVTEFTTAADFSRTAKQRVRLATVTSVTREGVVKSAQTPDRFFYRSRIDAPRYTVALIPADKVDTTAALEAYAQRRYPTAPTSSQIPPFDDLQAARAFLAPFRTHLTEA